MTIGWQKANLLNCLHMLSYGSAPNMMEGGFQLRPATLAQWPARARGWTCLCSGSRDAQSQQCVRRCAHHHERLLHFYAEQHIEHGRGIYRSDRRRDRPVCRSPAAQRDTVLDLYIKPIGVMS